MSPTLTAALVAAPVAILIQVLLFLALFEVGTKLLLPLIPVIGCLAALVLFYLVERRLRRGLDG